MGGAELIFGHAEWTSVMFGIELAVVIGFILMCAVYPITLFAKQVRRITR